MTKTAGLNRRDQKSLANLTLRKVMQWYHDKCVAAGVPHHEKVMPRSFRIGGATALFGAGVTAEEIKAVGRWFSDVYRIYCRLSKERLLQLSHRMSNSQSKQFLNGVDGFFSTVAPGRASPTSRRLSSKSRDSRPRPTETRTAVATTDSDRVQMRSQRMARPWRIASAKSSRLACATVALC